MTVLFIQLERPPSPCNGSDFQTCSTDHLLSDQRRERNKRAREGQQGLEA